MNYGIAPSCLVFSHSMIAPSKYFVRPATHQARYGIPGSTEMLYIDVCVFLLKFCCVPARPINVLYLVVLGSVSHLAQVSLAHVGLG